MKLHEYQARDLLSQNGVAVTSGRVASTAAEARAIAQDLGGKVVVKAQIHAGGRGKGRLVCMVQVKVPKNLSAKAKRLLLELDDSFKDK